MLYSGVTSGQNKPFRLRFGCFVTFITPSAAGRDPWIWRHSVCCSESDKCDVAGNENKFRLIIKNNKLRNDTNKCMTKGGFILYFFEKGNQNKRDQQLPESVNHQFLPENEQFPFVIKGRIILKSTETSLSFNILLFFNGQLLVPS